MSKNTEDPTIQAVRLLRESGYHEAAADLATKALQRAAATPAAPAPPASRPAPAFGEEAARREGEMIIAAMREKGILPAAEPIDGEAA